MQAEKTDVKKISQKKSNKRHVRVLPGKGNRPIRHYVVYLPVLCMWWKRYRAGSAALLQMRALLRHGGYQDVNVHCVQGKRCFAYYDETHQDMPHMPRFRRRPVEPGDVLPAMPWKWGCGCLQMNGKNNLVFRKITPEG